MSISPEGALLDPGGHVGVEHTRDCEPFGGDVGGLDEADLVMEKRGEEVLRT